jgi:hypothetical protein
MDTSKVILGGKSLTADEILGVAFSFRPVVADDAALEKVRGSHGIGNFSPPAP